MANTVCRFVLDLIESTLRRQVYYIWGEVWHASHIYRIGKMNIKVYYI